MLHDELIKAPVEDLSKNWAIIVVSWDYGRIFVEHYRHFGFEAESVGSVEDIPNLAKDLDSQGKSVFHIVVSDATYQKEEATIVSFRETIPQGSIKGVSRYAMIVAGSDLLTEWSCCSLGCYFRIELIRVILQEKGRRIPMDLDHCVSKQCLSEVNAELDAIAKLRQAHEQT